MINHHYKLYQFQSIENEANRPQRRRFSLGVLSKLVVIWRERRNCQHLIRPMKIMLLTTVCFVCAWLPYAVFAIVKQFFFIDQTIEPYIVAAAGLLAKSYIAFDPIVYVLTDDSFREHMCRYFMWR